MNTFSGMSFASRMARGFRRKVLGVLLVPLLLILGAGFAFGVTAVFDPATALRGVELIKGYLLENVLPAGAKPQAVAVRDTRLLQALHASALASLAEDRLLADELAINLSPSTAFYSTPIPPLLGRQGRSALGPEQDLPKPPVPMPYLHKNVDFGRFAQGYIGAPGGSGGWGSANSNRPSGRTSGGVVRIGYVPIQYVNIEYTPVPVPASALVLACSLLALAGFRRAARSGARPVAAQAWRS
jgi:hypothetical protein